MNVNSKPPTHSETHDDQKPKDMLQSKDVEPEHSGSIWTHPYMVYCILSGVLFILVTIVAWFAFSSGWIPNRGIE
jgi:hypothetical protein